MPIVFNEIETQRFGIRCARVVDQNATCDAINAVAREQDIVFLSLRVPTNDIRRVQTLEDDGYRLMDTLVYYYAITGNSEMDMSPVEGIDVRPAEASDIDQVGAVAGAAFAGYFGHFHADSRLQRSDCDAVYVDWAKGCVRVQSAELPVLVASDGTELVGFLSARRISDTCADIALNAVTPHMQGRGIYGSLLRVAMKQIAGSGFSEVTISTQINNIATQKAWGKCGFRMHSSYYTLHKWMDAQDRWS